jgi:hypothetical protein
MPVRVALADQVLELPQISASGDASPPSGTASDDGATLARSRPHLRAAAPLPKNLGTLQDYESENDEDASTGIASNFAGVPSNPRFDISGNNGQALAQNALLGALLIGLFAMEANAAHHHHHH